MDAVCHWRLQCWIDNRHALSYLVIFDQWISHLDLPIPLLLKLNWWSHFEVYGSRSRHFWREISFPILDNQIESYRAFGVRPQFSIWLFAITVNPVYSNRPRETQNVVFVDRFLCYMFLYYMFQWEKHFQGKKKCGLCRQVVTKADLTVLFAFYSHCNKVNFIFLCISLTVGTGYRFEEWSHCKGSTERDIVSHFR